MTTSLRSIQAARYVVAASLGAAGCTTFTSAELVERQPVHARVEAISSRHAAPDQGDSTLAETLRNEPESSFFSETNEQGITAHLQVRTAGASRFELGMELDVDALPAYHMEVVDDAPDGAGLLAIASPGTLSIHSRALGLVEGASIRIIDTMNDEVMSFILDMEEVMLEVHLDPGLYRLLIEGTLDAEVLQEEGTRSKSIPSPGTMLLLGGVLAGVRRRRS